MLPAIILLREKGYKTRACCSAHAMNDDLQHVYVIINGDHAFKTRPRGFTVTRETCYSEIPSGNDRVDHVRIERKLKGRTGRERRAEVRKYNAWLASWVSRLPRAGFNPSGSAGRGSRP
jgi:hypothetical protein